VDTSKLQIIYSPHHRPFPAVLACAVDPGILSTPPIPIPAVITQLQPITVIFSPEEDMLPEIAKQYSQGQKLVVEAYDRERKEKLATGRS